MSIAFSCVACDAPLSVRDELAGRRMRCTNCGSSNFVPELDDPDSSEEAGAATTARTNAGVAAFYRFLTVGCILIFVLAGFTVTLLIAGSAPVPPIEEVLVGGVKTSVGVLRQSDRLKEPRQVIGKVHKVTFKKGQSYVIDQESTDLDSYLILVDAKGQVVAEDDDGGGNFNARIIYRPQEDGEYRIIASSFHGQQTGAYKLTIREDDGKAALVQPMNRNRFPQGGQPGFPILGGFNEMLPQPKAPTSLKLAGGQLELADVLQQGDSLVLPNNAVGIGKIYEIELRGDRSYRIDLRSREFDSYLVLLAKDGIQILAQDDDGGGNLNARISYSPTATEMHRIVCTSLGKRQAGQYELTVTELPRGDFRFNPLPFNPPPQPRFPQPPRPEFRAPATPAELNDGKFEVKERIAFADKLAKVGPDFGKVYEMQLTANVTYRIELELDTPGKGPSKSARITVQSVFDNPAVTRSTSSSAKTAEMSFTPIVTGRYRIVATSTNGRYIGPFTLRVTEEK